MSVLFFVFLFLCLCRSCSLSLFLPFSLSQSPSPFLPLPVSVPLAHTRTHALTGLDSLSRRAPHPAFTRISSLSPAQPVTPSHVLSHPVMPAPCHSTPAPHTGAHYLTVSRLTRAPHTRSYSATATGPLKMPHRSLAISQRVAHATSHKHRHPISECPHVQFHPVSHTISQDVRHTHSRAAETSVSRPTATSSALSQGLTL